MRAAPRTLVIGLGNPILGDDSVGLHVARRLRLALAGRADIEVVEETHGGLRLMERMVGFERAIVVDALASAVPAGTIQPLALHGRPTRRSASSHDVDLPTALALGRQAGAALPADGDITLIGIVAHQVETFGETLTPAVAAAVPRAAKLVLAALNPKEESK